jgi:HK97 family phage prohead protease
MPMEPNAGESQSDFMARCVPEMMGTGPNARDQDQAVAICLDIWRVAHPENATRGGRRSRRQAPSPDEDESRADFMDRCMTSLLSENPNMDDDDARQMCEVAWGDGAAFSPAIVKSTTAPVHDFEFTLSDETVDRYGDIVSADGWELEAFKKNPVALFGHDFPIGKWTDLHVNAQDKALRGKLDIPKGVSARIDEIRRLVDAGYLKAVSVGFRALVRPKPIKDEAGDDTGGYRFVKHELLECSVVPVPANPNALAIAKALRISPDTLKLVFAEPGDRRQLVTRRAFIGESARTPPTTRHKPMPLDTFDQRIEDEQNLLNDLRDEQTEHLRTVDDRNPTDADDARTMELAREIARHERHLATLKAAQMSLAPGAVGEQEPPREDGDPPPARGRAVIIAPPRGRSAALMASSQIAIRRADGSVKYRSPRAAVVTRRKELDALDYIVRNGVIMLYAHRLRKSVDDVRKHLYGDDEMTKAAFDFIQKAATAPAMTTVDGWAAELVTQIQGDFMSPFVSNAIFPQLRARGISLDFGRAGRIAIPTRQRGPDTVAGAFIGEGQPIPVKQGLFRTQIITPKKLGVITVMTREIEDHSIPAIEGLLRDAISEDTGESIDSILLDTNGADEVRPAGILNGINPITNTPNTGDYTVTFNRMVRDIRNIRAALIGDTHDNIRAPCWIMNPIRADAIALTPAPGTGLFPFRDEIRAGSLEGWPLFESTILNQGDMIAVDAADFVTAGAGAPMFEVSDQATLHMDNVPGPITGPQPPAGAPGTATPVRSLWQTDSFALRLLYRLNWMLRRPIVARLTGLAW